MNNPVKYFEAHIDKLMLPVSMVGGIAFYSLIYHVPALQAYENSIMTVVRFLQPVLIFVMLFFQFIKISPGDIKICKWHFKAILIQSLIFVVTGLIASQLPEGNPKLLLECIMLCFICPTACAAGVITEKLGGNLSSVMTYVILINCTASVLIPVVFTYTIPEKHMELSNELISISSKVFSLLTMPCIAAMTIRFFFKKLFRLMYRYSFLSFYFWGMGLALALILTTGSLFHSNISPIMAASLAVVSLICCLSQFYAGRKIAAKYGKTDSISAGQALGQKNTNFMIWVALTLVNPVTSIAGGFYSIWHNIVNSKELYSLTKHQGNTSR